ERRRQPPPLSRCRLRLETVERETGFEPATSTLARSHSTAELLPLEELHSSGHEIDLSTSALFKQPLHRLRDRERGLLEFLSHHQRVFDRPAIVVPAAPNKLESEFLVKRLCWFI